MEITAFQFPIIPPNSKFSIVEDGELPQTLSSTRSQSQGPPASRTPLTFEEDSKRSRNALVSGSSAAGASTPGSSAHGSPALGSPNRFDAKALLNPKGASNTKRSSPVADPSHGIEDEESGSSMSSMLEKFHGLQQRQHAPIKRRKVDEAEISDGEMKQNGVSERITGSGMLGDALKEERRKLQESLPLRDTSLVDLTVEDEGDDCVVVEPTGPTPADEREVCLGRIDATASVDLVPTPKARATLKPSESQWPAMKISFRREFNVGVLIHLHDPTQRRFGKLDLRTASALAPLMDSDLQVRFKPSLDARKRLGEQAGSPTSMKMKLTILVFAPRKNVARIGLQLSRHQVKLGNTSATGLGVELVNPHAPQATSTLYPVPSTSAFGPAGFQMGASYVARTAEEVAHDVKSLFDSIRKTEDLPEKEADPRITTKLLSHQKQGLFFLTEREMDHTVPSQEQEGEAFSLWRSRYKSNGNKVYFNVITGHESSHRPPPVLGGILADMMGLGKTLSILSLVVDSMEDAQEFAKLVPHRTPQLPLILNSKATLLVCPLSVVSNWEDQIKSHIQPDTFSYYVYHGSSRTQDIHELAKYDMVITSYHTLAAELKKNGGKRPIFLTHWFRIVLDEAHSIRTQSTGQSLAVCEVEAQRRWAVTGTPIQNRLDDLGALIKFLRIKPFDEKRSFNQFIITPFKQMDIEIIPKLRLLVDSITLRRQKDHIDLPARSDNIERLDASDAEAALYQLFLDDSRQKVKAIARGSQLRGKQYATVLKTITRLRLLCAHGEELLSEEDRKLTEGISYDKAIDLSDEDDVDRPAMTQKQAFELLGLLRDSDVHNCVRCQNKIEQTSADEDEDFEVKPNTNTIGWLTPCFELMCPNCFPRYLEEVAQAVQEDNFLSCPNPSCKQWIRNVWFEIKQSELDEDDRAKARVRANPKTAKQLGFYHGPHTKTKALMVSLKSFKEWSDNNPEEAPIKSVVFSSWTNHLDLIQFALEENNFTYTRLDGSMSRKQRGQALSSFRDDPNVHVFLISIGAGGLGLNLTSASKVFIMEPQFNPGVEAQAVERVHRLGQTRDVAIVRYIMRGTIEETILEIQDKKKQMAELTMDRKAMTKGEQALMKLQDLNMLFKR